ncbi:MAG TPA: TolC family protein, partial [Candidatus Binataceae bacterium]|nr:TolC family protein [Candidatus Binataceae bacterium]
MRGGRQIAGAAFVAIIAAFSVASNARAQSGLDANQLVEVAIESNPQIRSMRAQWDAAQHQILQNYAPADPVFTYANVDASHGLLNHAATHSHQATENFQFPGKALLQAEQAQRTAKIARFAYEAAIRDLRANVETGYYQILLDDALLDVNSQNIENLHEILKV